jgi:hypothetical protein
LPRIQQAVKSLEMATGLTVADAREALYQQIDPSNAATTLFLPALNAVSERIINSGQWKNMYGQVDYPSTTGYIVLPPWAESIIGVTYVNSPGRIESQMNEFMTAGPGFYDKTDINIHNIIDQGDICMQNVQTEGGTPKFAISNAADALKTVRVYGYYTNGDGEVYDPVTGIKGIEVVLNAAPVTMTQDMFVTQIVKEVTLGYVTMSVVVGATTTVLSVYQPPETNPIYRYYKVGTIPSREDEKPVLRCKVKRRFLKMREETDLVWPDNLGALKFALIAYQMENQGAFELQQSETFWQKCYQVLNQGLKQNRGGIRPLLAFDYFQSAGSTPRVH